MNHTDYQSLWSYIFSNTIKIKLYKEIRVLTVRAMMTTKAGEDTINKNDEDESRDEGGETHGATKEARLQKHKREGMGVFNFK